MWSVNWSISKVLDLSLHPFRLGYPLWPLALLSILTAIVMLIVFRYTSNQLGIRQTKNRIKAHLLELRLFKDDLTIIIAAQKQIFLHNARYMMYAVKPMLVIIIPMALLLMHMDSWFGYRPLQPGETVMVTVRITDQEGTTLDDITLEAGPGLVVETPPLRIPEAREVDWRLRANDLGLHKVSVDVSGHRLDKQVVVAQGLFRLSSSRLSSKFYQTLLHPSELPLPESSRIQRIDISYPTRFIRFFHWDIHWLVYFFVLSAVFAFALKSILKVEL